MGKLTLTGETPPGNLEGLKGYVANLSKDVHDQVNGNLLFGANIKCAVLDVIFTAAGSDFLIRHTLGKVPTGYWLVSSDVTANIFTGSVAATNQTITLRCSAIATTKVLVF